MRGRMTTGVASAERRVAKIPVRAEGINIADIAAELAGSFFAKGVVSNWLGDASSRIVDTKDTVYYIL